MEPLTTVGAGLAVLGSKDILNRLLGPTADYVGGEVKNLVEKCNINLDRIFRIAVRKAGEKIENSATVSPRVLKSIIEEGRFCEDEIASEYYGGLLSSSRSKDGKDDRALGYLNVIAQLSVYQIRFHYVAYILTKQLFDSEERILNIQRRDIRERLRIFLPFSEAFQSAGIEDIEATKKGFNEAESIFVQTLHGLERASLIEQINWGHEKDLRKRGYPKVPGDGLFFSPTSFGAELALWVSGQSAVPTKFFLAKELKLDQIPEISIPQNAIPAAKLKGS